ncbi:MAG: hypothetical protein A2268_16340 [Candidatus Raymondbacteria bacterium RifOxyA12_full_50_37]|uniref:Outer membrane protein beta-barrel domain-containing protein n=1 Tax=Candidatus Raymondbacteria bacterium RIFOXYD12_FULL_49_13 TaxID=1817890 RepID=A0A1F7F7Z2_UNCRA|nr:MAG: hypothetical protein A2268_16340 [Candidatus Raymondbacteria bacterium RifOxyA12_full_50_37]OGJ94367.1 MAG: hypothetical protein A2248_14535 [Candidatus Raymondbacteria bacterium RIFOXYA2_FULL_49_16]OGJ95128.1 MAG: hypothetical protein A2350_09290 [Candidatus Raymondbacteria bacterium RifOxyB12_full_50_8]OGJ95309.1 MAG: hypothetical protein A2453_05960 [Candidatus Raymondbacteria bacterium RIFOXYC2_FULL_50_21]OGJ99804.1 MAG: hypothetical protein A2487_10725 [Candidatus Raymondbacteria b
MLTKTCFLALLFLSISLMTVPLFASAEMKDDCFDRFFKKSVIDGSSTPGKYNLDVRMGKAGSTLGFIFDVKNPFVKKDNISQTFGLLFYKFEDTLVPPAITPANGTSIIGITAFSLAYGWNWYGLPLNTNLYAGLNLYMGGETRMVKQADGTLADKGPGVFAPAPYFYFVNPWSEKVKTKLDIMVSHNWQEMAKLAAEVFVTLPGWMFESVVDRTGSTYSDSYRSSVGIAKRLTTKQVLGLFIPAVRNAPEGDSSMAQVDAMFGGSTGYLKFSGGTTFTVNNVIGETFADKAGSSDNYYFKGEFSYILLLGLGYKVGEGLGFRFGLNYGLNLDAISTMQGQSQGIESAEKAGFFSLKHKTVYVALEYMNDYVAEDIFGSRVVPSMFHISLAIR